MDDEIGFSLAERKEIKSPLENYEEKLALLDYQQLRTLAMAAEQAGKYEEMLRLMRKVLEKRVQVNAGI